MCKCTIIRFLKVDDTMFIYEEFNGRALKEISINWHCELNKSQTKKSTSVIVLISSEPATKLPKFQDKTHPVTKEAFIEFLGKTAKLLEEMNMIKEINIPRVLSRLMMSKSKKHSPIKLLHEKKLTYTMTQP